MRAEIIYEDREVIVAYKPAGLATQSSGVGQPDLVSELKNYLNDPYLGIVHRLDQPVEGLLVFGKTKSSAAALTGQLSGQSLNKRYYALLCGQPSEREGKLTDHLCKSAQNRAVIVPKERAGEAGAKEARLEYQILESLSLGEILRDGTDGILSLARISIETGRFHQIRAQMSHAGLPLLGDVKYQDARSGEMSAKLRARNVCLCAYELEFVHPADRRALRFEIRPRERMFQYFSIMNSG